MFNGILYFRKKYLSLDKIRKLVEKMFFFSRIFILQFYRNRFRILFFINKKYVLNILKKQGLDFNFCISNIIVEPYNVILSHNTLIEYLDVSVILNNEAIYDICRSQLDINTSNYNNLNRLIS
jgi:tubulin alpha